MARIRTVKPEFFQHPRLCRLPFAARLLAIGLLGLADCQGRMVFNRKFIDGHVFPQDDVDLIKLCNLLQGAGWLRRYEVDGIEYLAVLNFRKHQRLAGREAKARSKFPGPPRETANASAGDTALLPESLPDDHPRQQRLVTGTGNREQGKEQEPPKAPRGPSEIDTLFAHWQDEVERVTGKRPRTKAKTFRSWASPRLKDSDLATCKRVVTWAARSPHQRARHLRDGDYLTGQTLWRASKFAEYETLSEDGRRSAHVGAAVDNAPTVRQWLDNDSRREQWLYSVARLHGDSTDEAIWNYTTKRGAEFSPPDALRDEAIALVREIAERLL